MEKITNALEIKGLEIQSDENDCLRILVVTFAKDIETATDYIGLLSLLDKTNAITSRNALTFTCRDEVEAEQLWKNITNISTS